MDTEPSSVTLNKTGDDSQIRVNILQFQNFTKGCLNQRYMPKRDQRIKTLLRRLLLTYIFDNLNILTDLKGPKKII